jgi:hypothetical protein
MEYASTRLILQALAMLKDIKDNVYGEHVLPECKRVNRAIATVDDTIKVHAIVESNTSNGFV